MLKHESRLGFRGPSPPQPNQSAIDSMPVADGPMLHPSASHSLADAFKRASHGAEGTSQPPTTRSPEAIDKDRGLHVDDTTRMRGTAPPGRNHSGYHSGHTAQDDASELGRRSPRLPGGQGRTSSRAAPRALPLECI